MALPISFSSLARPTVTMSLQVISSVDILLCASALVILYKLYVSLMKPVRLPYPPGPPGYPLIGHVKTPEEPGWVIYRDWSQQYGALNELLGGWKRTADASILQARMSYT